MNRSLAFLSLCSVLLFAPAATAERHPVTYEVVAYCDASSGFTREAKLFVQVDERCPAAHRDEVARVAEAARKQGLHCVSKEDADFELVVNFNSGPSEAHPEGYTLFGLSGYVFPLLDHGSMRGARSVWEGIVNGRKGSIGDRGKMPPPYVEVGTVAAKLVESIGREMAESPIKGFTIGGDTPGMAMGGPLDNPPPELVKQQPRIDDFNRIARKFFESELFDFGEPCARPDFVRILRGQTANELYRKLKLRETEFAGAIHVSPMPSGDENIIVVAVRIAQQKGSTKTLYTRYLHIRFSVGNMLRGVDRGMYVKQEF